MGQDTGLAQLPSRLDRQHPIQLRMNGYAMEAPWRVFWTPTYDADVGRHSR